MRHIGGLARTASLPPDISHKERHITMTSLYEVHGPVAVITLNNPPVNGLGYATRLSVTQQL